MRWKLLAVAVATLVVVVAGGGAAACKFTSLNCGIRESPQDASATELADGFQQEVVLTGLNEPTDVAFLGEDRVLISEKAGLVRVSDESNELHPQPMLDLRERVNTEFFRGLIAIQVDPDFDANGFLYALYVMDDDRSGPKGPRTMRLSRFTVRGNTAPLDTERVLLGRVWGGSCDERPSRADCLPSNVDHNGGDIVFARDGTMFVATGDGGGLEGFEKTALSAQDPDALGGKVLRMTRAGRGVEGNPLWNGDPDANRSKVWGMGFRNPFRLALAPGHETPHVGDVGWRDAEEINAVPRGSNHGWPCFEGTRRQPVFASHAVCRRLFERSPRSLREPVTAYGRDEGGSVTLGTFYTAENVPRAYRNTLVYGDFIGGWLRMLRVRPDGTPAGEPRELASSTGGAVAVGVGPDDALYYLSYNAGELRRITYAP
jgi:glucose/arabinose dehydrogenase